MSTGVALRVAFVGWGAMARETFRLIDDALIEVVAVAIRPGSEWPRGLPSEACVITEPHELALTMPDVVAETASHESVGPWGRAALGAGADFVVSSVAAFADKALLEELQVMAAHHRAQIQIQPGALGGVEALAAASAMGIEEVEHRITKPPSAWLGTPAEERCALDSLNEPQTFFTGTAADAASRFPKNANVAMTTALAGIGPERTRVTLVADPKATGNRHEITALGDFGKLDVLVSSHPLSENPKTSAMAALNLARCLRNRARPLIV
ncbi:MAG: aspartate dehydrogenase [Acidimicrobiales bacterium]|nr:aspartate dehydrogenase [Acidimicrobiales bacterium]